MPRNDKWKGAAAWSAKEARAGDRLPYVRLIDENTLLLRDGSVMTAIQVPGLLFETEDSEALNAHAATREVVLRSTLDARFVLYHHVIRRRVSVELSYCVRPSMRGSYCTTTSSVAACPLNLKLNFPIRSVVISMNAGASGSVRDSCS